MALRLTAYSRRTKREYVVDFMQPTEADYNVMITNLYAIANNDKVELVAFECHQMFFAYLAAIPNLHVRDVVQTIIPKKG
jgi:hypothetical protein